MNQMKWTREPLLHFFLLGALLFGVYTAVSDEAPGEDEIVVTRGVQEHLIRGFTRAWQRPPTQPEFVGIVDDWIREEIAYREGLRMSLDTDDIVIRRRLKQKLELLAEDLVALAEPTTEDLQEYLDQHAQDYVAEPLYTLRQIYFSPETRGPDVDREAKVALRRLTAGAGSVDPETTGDPISVPHRFVDERASALEAVFGRGFPGELQGLAPQRWQGPVRSGLGLHLVLVESYEPGGPMTLQQAEQEVRRDWESTQRKRAIETLYERLGMRYRITVEPLPDVEGPMS